MRLKELFSLENKNSIVTGGTGYLGKAIVEALAEFGSNVCIASRNITKCEKLARELSKVYDTEIWGSELLIESVSSVEESFQKISMKSKYIDILVNNAAFSAPGQLGEISEIDWLKGIDGTINGVFRCTNSIIPYMRKGSGSILNIASMYGMVSPNSSIYGKTGFNNPPNYGAGKAGIIQFTRFAACHLASKGIRVNSISPGAFPNKKVQENVRFIDELNKKTPLNRIGKPYELKGAVVYLTSEASSFVTGHNLVVDGGWTAW